MIHESKKDTDRYYDLRKKGFSVRNADLITSEERKKRLLRKKKNTNFYGLKSFKLPKYKPIKFSY